MTITASIAATRKAITLAHAGIATPAIETSQPSTTRTSWSSATSAKTATAR